MSWSVASDVGGTFTDIAHVDDDCVLHTAKVASQADNYGRGVINGIMILASAQNYKIESLKEVLHGCTVATNAILEGKGAKTALITTSGFKDVLELRRIRVPRLYEPLYVKPLPLCPRDLRFEVTERIGAAGNVIQELDKNEVVELARQLKDMEVEAVAVCFLHSYVNDAHERMVGAILRELLPDVFVTLSVEVLPQIREYERTSTTVINAYVGPPVKGYLDRLDHELQERGTYAPVYVMQSSGGQLHSATVKEIPAQIVECGPAAGVIAAQYVAKKICENNVITFDMGGTTAKASMIEQGRLTYSDDYEIGSTMSSPGTIAGGGGYALGLPVINIAEVGAGGGSIVSLDKANALRIGPQSAGAFPGPACYGNQDEYVTVTDANVLLGYLSPIALAGGAIEIDAKLSESVLGQRLSTKFSQKMTTQEIAFGIHTLANETMVKAIKAVTTYRGRDPRDFTMIAFGGNGGIHGVGIARSLGIKRVIVPICAGVFSAVGLAVAERKVTIAAAHLVPLYGASEQAVARLYDELSQKGSRLLKCEHYQATTVKQLDLRLKGQAFDLTIDLGSDQFSPDRIDDITKRFIEEYEIRYSHAPDKNSVIEIVALRMIVTDSTYEPPKTLLMKDEEPRVIAQRNVYFGDGQHDDVNVVNRSFVRQQPVKGPLIIEEYEGTTIVPPDAYVRLDEMRNIVIDFRD
ncbi:hydantoinase/oxoprolinase family protein [Pusillimonas sp. ANT_WB101]|uniref:hydantoinase/oxoprolinase family protein n=1 Tax=Pusillimonas sp. ANT_WB101 TaxID=2597356 RepID=UPI0011EC9BE0|nr:hydantoinase/oxoprolinase family protein [Pusillimonas sp. ANT_WB101]KAA0892566.1 hydantoinase/oxoprolinase family protein [Pusillimonas sp. ANT_WB101]